MLITVRVMIGDRDALLKMQDVYRQDSSFGDPASLDSQLEENARKLDELKKEVSKYQACTLLLLCY